MVILPKAIYRFNAIPIKFQSNSSQTSKEQCSTSYGKKIRLAKTILYNNKGCSGGIIIPDSKLCYKVTEIKTAWYWHKNRHVVQFDLIDEPDTNPHTYEHLAFGKEDKSVQWKKESIFNKLFWHKLMSTCRRMHIDPYLSPCSKLKSKWIKDLNMNLVIHNLIEEKMGSSLECMGTGDYFLNIKPVA